ncbi:class I SAM-dependent RNA methyltransferase [Sphingosinicella sp.]|uniref:class I SAM-dependent RNA methyltransferase n=1 Tax=Sphingosinicella sp. TaxID=1917971 RepID=UPI004037A9C9
MSERVVRIAARGDGVTTSGRYVPLAAPGDVVDEAGAVTPGRHHATPPCRHFPECGGCQLQHVDDEAYRAYLVDRVAGALAAQSVSIPEIRPSHLSPPRSRRRATLKAMGGAVGFNAAASHRIVDMRECHILRPELFALVAPLRRLLKGRAEATLTLADQGVDLLLGGVAADDLAAAESFGAFAANHQLARLSLDDGYGAQTRWEPVPVTITLGGVAVGLPQGAFLQATADGEEALVDAVREAVGDAATVADLFAGLGTFALALGARIYAAEASRDAAQALKVAAGAAGQPVFVEHRDLYRQPLDPAELDRFGAVVLDPPRAGAEAQVERLATSRVPRIAYVSCNPATFARDAKRLAAGGYRLDWVRPVGQFRWSVHVELAASFSRVALA